MHQTRPRAILFRESFVHRARGRAGERQIRWTVLGTTTMKFAIAVLVLACILAIALFARSRRVTQAAPAVELRQMALTTPASDFGIEPLPGEAWCVVMDTTYPNASVSLLSLSDGGASLYFSTGGGVIGGQTHANVAAAAKAFVTEATRFRSKLGPSTDLALPFSGRTRFYVRTDTGTFVTEVSESELAGGNHALSPLFFAGQEVVTQLRVVSEGRVG